MNQEAQKLSQLLNQESTFSANLLQFMLLEKDMLETNRHDELHKITESKADCLDQIEQTSRNRAQFLLAVSTAPSTVARMNEFIDKQHAPIQESLRNSLNELEQTLEQCRHQNAVNGMVISMSHRNVQRNLNILKGVDKDTMTYTQKGQTSTVGKQYAGLKV
ncbi:MAG: flagellar protein FlgN [Gammaproteobacteria bacterium]|nr:flagellar protein FlgN [Gammaproteobacteria bacterium]